MPIGSRCRIVRATLRSIAEICFHASIQPDEPQSDYSSQSRADEPARRIEHAWREYRRAWSAADGCRRGGHGLVAVLSLGRALAQAAGRSVAPGDAASPTRHGRGQRVSAHSPYIDGCALALGTSSGQRHAVSSLRRAARWRLVLSTGWIGAAGSSLASRNICRRSFFAPAGCARRSAMTL